MNTDWRLLLQSNKERELELDKRRFSKIEHAPSQFPLGSFSVDIFRNDNPAYSYSKQYCFDKSGQLTYWPVNSRTPYLEYWREAPPYESLIVISAIIERILIRQRGLHVHNSR